MVLHLFKEQMCTYQRGLPCKMFVSFIYNTQAGVRYFQQCVYNLSKKYLVSFCAVEPNFQNMMAI